MQDLTINEILKATGGSLVCGSADTEFNSITTDSRKAKNGVLFIALEGEKFDGHEFIGAAFDLGASAVLTHKDTEPMVEKTIIKVENTLKALGDIARFYMDKYRIPSVAVTGSVGKTTTKDMIYSVLSTRFNTRKTQKNFNNEIGLPWTVLSIEKEHEAAVFEMGMNHFGEIERLADIARPDTAVITNIGMSHIENLGSREGIFKAKMEITKLFGKNNTLIVNGDDGFLSKTKGMGEYKVIYYGIKNPENDISAYDIADKGIDGVEFSIRADGESCRISVPVAGEHNVYNALAAICVGLEYNIPMEKIKEGLNNPKLTPMRMEIEKFGDITVINDCYNASPDSIAAALKVLNSMEGKRKIAVLGDVLEMGEYAKESHYAIGKAVVENKADVLITVGENAKHTADAAREGGMKNVISFDKTLKACEQINGLLKEGDAVLVKASRGMHFEDIVEAIKNCNQ